MISVPTHLDREEVLSAARHVLGFHGEQGGFPPGSFTQKLLETWSVADLANAGRLSLGFPEYGFVLSLYRHYSGARKVQTLVEELTPVDGSVGPRTMTSLQDFLGGEEDL